MIEFLIDSKSDVEIINLGRDRQVKVIKIFLFSIRIRFRIRVEPCDE
jgi:hypothetical protein